MNAIRLIAFVINLLICTTGSTKNEGCRSPQYLEVGRKGTIICSFQEGFYRVLWYNSRDYVRERAIVDYEDSVKRGDGITSGEFNIYPNGSLIVNNVTYGHDHDFTVIKLNSVLDEYVPHYVRVIVTVKPTYPYPVIKRCGHERNFCFSKVQDGSDLTCFIRDTRPGVTLKWMTRTNDGDKNVSYDFSKRANGELMTSVATTSDPFAYTAGLSLLVCKAETSPALLQKYESLIILQSASVNLTLIKPVSSPVQIKHRLELKCAENGISYLVWKYKHESYDEFQEVLYAVVVRDNLSIIMDGYELKLGESLVIPSVRIENEGLYGCIYGNGTFEGMTAYDVTVYVTPVPAYPVVEGCSHEQYCVLQAKREGTLTCTIKGIRPKVKLTWQPFHDSGSEKISFQNQETTVTENDDGTFDVSLTSHFNADHSSTNKLTVQCRVLQTDIQMLQLNTILDLVFVTESNEPTEGYLVPTEDTTKKKTSAIWVIVVVIVGIFVLMVLVCSSLVLKAKYCSRRKPQVVLEQDKDEKIKMLPPQVSIDSSSDRHYEEKKEKFTKELRAKYEVTCESIHPIPYIREKMYSVQQVFVEGGFEFMDDTSKTWKNLESYHDIFNSSDVKSLRRIIEGKAGYGKSTLALQFAYEWYKSFQESPLRNKELLILLRLRQLGGITSVYTAIKQVLLPKDTQLSENDIKLVLQQSKSVVVVLDGFDEYPDIDMETDSFVYDILNRQLFQQFEVILTTRSGCLPKNYAPQTRRIRLTGFHDNAQEEYLQNVIGVGDATVAEKVKEALQCNPFLDDICRVPLFFVLFAHICADEKCLPKFSSVTPFFRYIISCLHIHRRNKIQGDSASKYYEQFETEHPKLDKIAFDALCTKQPQVWDKEWLMKELGEDFYTQYVSIGVLVEEEDVHHINEDPGLPISDFIRRRKDVTFYHSLFCEWYAAHFLSGIAAKPEVKFDPRDKLFDSRDELNDGKSSDFFDLQNLDPANVQYVYRFACGLNPSAAETIYQYLKSRVGGEKFAVLCLLEQTGKFEKIKKTIEKFCESSITIHGAHSKLDQKSTIQQLEMASRQQIPITHLWLNNCFESVNYTWKQILLTSGAKIPKLYTLQALDIRENEKEVTKQKAESILQYCVWCLELQTVKFVCCLMPQSLSATLLNPLRERNVKVLWDTDFTSVFKLNISSGHWQHEDDGVQMTEDEYKEQVDMLHRLRENKLRKTTDQGQTDLAT